MASLSSSTKLLNAKEITDSLDVTDPTTYSWRFRFSMSGLKLTLILVLTGILVAPSGIARLCWLVSFGSPQAAFWLATVLGALATVGLAINFYNSWRSDNRVQRIRARGSFWASGALILGTILYLLSAPDSKLATSFANGKDAPFWQWYLYILDQMLTVIFLDFPEVFGMHLSNIHYDGTMSRVVTILIRAVMTLGVVRILHRTFEMLRHNVEFFTVAELYEHCKNSPSKDHLTIQRVGEVRDVSRERALKFLASTYHHALKDQEKVIEGRSPA